MVREDCAEKQLGLGVFLLSRMILENFKFRDTILENITETISIKYFLSSKLTC